MGGTRSGVHPSGNGKLCHPQCDRQFPAKVCNPVPSAPKQNSPLPSGSRPATSFQVTLCRATSARRSMRIGEEDSLSAAARSVTSGASRQMVSVGSICFIFVFFQLIHLSAAGHQLFPSQRIVALWIAIGHYVRPVCGNPPRRAIPSLRDGRAQPLSVRFRPSGFSEPGVTEKPAQLGRI